MFPSILPSANAFLFPIVQNVGSLKQDVTDSTQLTLRFAGNGSAPGVSGLTVHQSVGGAGPWTVAYENNTFTLDGSPEANIPILAFGPYAKNNYFRYRWENIPSLGYVGPWSTFAGPTTKNRWDTTTYPIAPTAITGVSHSANRYVTVSVQHSLLESADFSNTGIKITATVNYSNGLNVTTSQFFVGWGASTVTPEDYVLDFSDRSPLTIVLITSAKAEYYVLGDPPPGTIGSPRNYP